MCVKKGIYIVSVLSFFILLMSCGSGDSSNECNESTGGKISGTAQFNTKSGSVAAYKVKLVARNTKDDSIVSNVVDLGTAPDTSVEFSLDINFTKVTNPALGDIIALSMWMDMNDNNVIDNGEDYTSVVPNGTCPVFKDAFTCGLMYEGYWSIMTGNSESEPFDDAVKSGANVISGAPVDL